MKKITKDFLIFLIVCVKLFLNFANMYKIVFLIVVIFMEAKILFSNRIHL